MNSKWLLQIVSLIMPMWLLFSAPGSASPTSEDFIPCKQIAVNILKTCLDEKNQSCWSKSESAYHSCREQVISGHASDPVRIEAMKKERQKREGR